MIRALPLLLTFLVSLPAAGAEWPDLSATPDSTGGGEQDAAVIVSIEDYTFLSDVPGAGDNARDWRSWLKNTRGVPAVRVLENSAATRNSILDAVGEAARRVGDGGTLWFVFIGHGAPSEDGTDGVLVDAVAQQRVLDFYPNTITRSDLMAALEEGPQAETVVVLDACFSGRDTGGQALVDGLQPALVSGTWQPRRSTVMTAAAGDEFAGPLPGVARPAFSYLVLGALQGWGDRDGDLAVTAAEAVDYASDALFELAADRRQTPALLGAGSNPVLSRLNAPVPGPDLAMLMPAETARPVETFTFEDWGEDIHNELTDETGFLVVRVDPPEASIYVNNEEVGRGAVQLERMVGEYVVGARLGTLYHPEKQRVELGTDGARLALNLAPAFGTLRVTSDPPGADVWLDGDRVGATPWTDDRRRSGSYELRLTLEDYLSDTATVAVVDGRAIEHAVRLEENFGQLQVRSDPPGAAIWLNGRDTGAVTPHTFDRVAAGVAEVRLRLDGYGEVVQRPSVERRQLAVADLALDAKLGLLTVLATYRDGSPCEGEVYVDGEPRGLAPLKLKLPARSYDIEVRAEDRADRQRVTVVHNDKVTAELVVPVDGPLAALPPRAPPVVEDPAPEEGPPVDVESTRTVVETRFDGGAKLKRRRTAGGVMAAVGGAAAAGGFILNAAIYRSYIGSDEQELYEWAARTAHGGLALGIAGAATGVVGLLVAVAPQSQAGRVGVIPGPVPTVVVSF